MRNLTANNLFKTCSQMVAGKYEIEEQEFMGSSTIRKVGIKETKSGEHVGVVLEMDAPVGMFDIKDIHKFVDQIHENKFEEVSLKKYRSIVDTFAECGFMYSTINSLIKSLSETENNEDIARRLVEIFSGASDDTYYYFDWVDYTVHKVMRPLTNPAKAVIEAYQTRVCVGDYDANGEFEYVLFAHGDTVYKITKDMRFFKVSAPYSLERPMELKVNFTCGSQYPRVSINEIPVYVHHLASMLLVDDRGKNFDKYMSSSCMCVNHIVNTEPVIADIYNVSRRYVPDARYAYKPEYLEIVTTRENNGLGKFCSEYGICDVPIAITVGDIKEVKKLVKTLVEGGRQSDIRSEILNLYKSQGFFMDF